MKAATGVQENVIETEPQDEPQRRRRRRKRSRQVKKTSKSLDALLLQSPGRPAIITLVMMTLALVLGGGGTVNPLTEMVLEIAFAAVLLPEVLDPTWGHAGAPVPRELVAITALALAIPLLQLVPLPPSLWQALPGRTIEKQSLDLINAGSSWMPLSMVPSRTFSALLAMLCPIALLIQVSRLDLSARTLVCVVITVVALLSAALGTFQVVHFGGSTWSLYSEAGATEGWLIGFHSNRNAETDTLQIAIMGLAVAGLAYVGTERPYRIHLALIGFAAFVLTLATILTGSRSGLVLYPLTLVFFVAILWPRLTMRFRNFRLVLAGVTAGVLVVGFKLAQLEAIQRTIDRFGDAAADQRLDLWRDTLYAAGNVWPFGSGISTFQPLLQAAERLEVVDASFPVRAHNDWLEFVLESGAIGIAALVAIGGVLLVLNYRALRSILTARSEPVRRAQILFATGTLLHLGLHAIGDYPMRSIALASLAAVAVALLTPVALTERDAGTEDGDAKATPSDDPQAGAA